MTADGDIKIFFFKAGRNYLGEDVKTFNDPRHLAIISVKFEFFE